MPTAMPSYDTALSLATRKLRPADDDWRAKSMLTPDRLAGMNKDSEFNAENRRLQEEAEAATPPIVNRQREDEARAAGEPLYESYVEPHSGQYAKPIYLKPPASAEPPPLAQPPPAPPAPPVRPPDSRPLSAAANPQQVITANRAAGPETAVTERAAGNEPAKPVRAAGQDYHDRMKAVRLPSGRIVFTNTPGAFGGEQADYGEAMESVTGRPYKGGVNIYEGSEGTVYSHPGQEASVGAALDRAQPPPSLEASLPPLDDPVAIWERQQWLESRAATERAARGEEAKTVSAEAGAETAARKAAVDPMKLAELESESRYGGEMITQQGKAEETRLALKTISQIVARQNEIRSTMPPGPEREALLDQLESDKKFYLIAIRPQAAAGLMRPDPYGIFGQMAPPIEQPAAKK